MFLKTLDLEKGMAGTESLRENSRLFDPCSIHGTWLSGFSLCNEDFCVTETSCLFQKEFQDQLKLFEEKLSDVSLLAVDSLFKEHEQKLSYSTGQIRLLFNKQLEDWEHLKVCVMDIR